MSQEDIRRAVQLLVQAPDDALFAVRTELLGAFIRLRKRLRLSTDRCVEALDALSAKTKEIKGKQADVAGVVGKISSRQADVRLQHIYAEQPGGKGFDCRVRAIFAYRSLGFEFDKYMITRHGASRVTELASDFRKADERSSGRIHEFLREKGLENDSPSQKAVRFAIKVLVLERTFGDCGISWLVSFIFSKIRNLPYLSLADISHLLSQRGGDYSTLGELATSFSNLIRTGQQQYDALVGPDVISQNSHQDRRECLTQHRPTSDLPAETETSIERNPDPTVDLLTSSSQSDVSVPSSTSSQSSDTTPEAGVLCSDTPGAPSLHDHVLERELADRDQTSETGRIAHAAAAADDEGERAGLHPPKRKRISSSHAREQSQPLGSQLRMIASSAPAPVHSYSNLVACSSYLLNSQSHARCRPSYMDKTPIGFRQHPSSNTNFWSVVDDRAIDRASSHNQSGQIPDASNASYGQSAMSQQRYNAWAGRPYREVQADLLHGQRPSNPMFGNPSGCSRGFGEMDISGDFPAGSNFMATLDLQHNPRHSLDPPSDGIQFNVNDILDPPFDGIQFNVNDILDPPFDGIQFNVNDILDPPFDGIQFNVNDILDPPSDGIQFNVNDILDPPFDGIQFNVNDILDPSLDSAQFNLGDRTGHISPLSVSFET